MHRLTPVTVIARSGAVLPLPSGSRSHVGAVAPLAAVGAAG